MCRCLSVHHGKICSSKRTSTCSLFAAIGCGLLSNALLLQIPPCCPLKCASSRTLLCLSIRLFQRSDHADNQRSIGIEAQLLRIKWQGLNILIAHSFVQWLSSCTRFDVALYTELCHRKIVSKILLGGHERPTIGTATLEQEYIPYQPPLTPNANACPRFLVDGDSASLSEQPTEHKLGFP